jgi:hypothetical protein
MANKYQVDTVIQLSGQFWDVQANLMAEPQSVLLIIEDPTGTITQYAPPAVAHAGLGLYTYQLETVLPGKWTYKFQGYGPSGVVATSRDRTFFVQASPLIPA